MRRRNNAPICCDDLVLSSMTCSICSGFGGGTCSGTFIGEIDTRLLAIAILKTPRPRPASNSENSHILACSSGSPSSSP